MNHKRRVMSTLALAAGLQLLCLAAAAALLGAALPPGERQVMGVALGAHWPWAAAALLLPLAAVSGYALWPRGERPREAGSAAGEHPGPRDSLHSAVGHERSRLERERLRTLMAQLPQGALVCRLDGRIVECNDAARACFPALARPAGSGKAPASIHGPVDADLVAHVLDAVRRMPPLPLAFITASRAGWLMRVRAAAVGPAAPAQPPDGFVLLVEDATEDFERQAARERLLKSMTERSRSALANLLSVADMLDLSDADPDERSHYIGMIRAESQALAADLSELEEQVTRDLAQRWPLEPMRGAELVRLALQRLEAMPGLHAGGAEVETALWLRVDPIAMLLALRHLARRLRDEAGTRGVRLRLTAASEVQANLDLLWSGQLIEHEAARRWELEPLDGSPSAPPLSLREVVQRHGGEFRLEREYDGRNQFFRFVLPRDASEPSQSHAR